MKKSFTLKTIFYSALFSLLGFPAKAFGAFAEAQPLYGVETPTTVDRISSLSKFLAAILIPVIVIVLVIVGIRKFWKKKK